MYYFTYGTDLNRKQMKERCPDSRPLFTAVLPNYKLIFTGWNRQWRGGTANLKSFRGEKVKGAVYEVSEADLRRLDKHEGCPNESKRLNVGVFDEDGNITDAVTYIRLRQSEEARPSPEYLAIIRQGYRDWQIA